MTRRSSGRPRGGDLRVEDLTPREQSLGDGRVKTQAEVDAALEALWARARASEEGYVAARAFDPDDLDDAVRSQIGSTSTVGKWR